MARSLLVALARAGRQIEKENARQRRLAAREHAAAIRQAEQARKAEIRALKAAASSAKADQKQFERKAKEAHVAFMEAKVLEKNTDIARVYDDIDTLLAATLDVDDYVDLETLRRTTKHPPFDRSDLEKPTPVPEKRPGPIKPTLMLPKPHKGFFGRKKHAAATAAAESAHSTAARIWEQEIENLQALRKKEIDHHEKGEQSRVVLLEKERKRFVLEILEHNKQLETFINNLAYGDPVAIQEYVSIVVANSVYPKHFQVKHDFRFKPETAELEMKVEILQPREFPTTKAFKYTKSSDEIKESTLSQKEIKERYSSAIYQVGIRSFHEIFEADRKGLIKAISLEVGTQDTDPAIGKLCFIPFLAAAAERDAFLEFELSGIVPAATLKHLGASISKNPYDLVAVNTSGVRRS